MKIIIFLTNIRYGDSKLFEEWRIRKEQNNGYISSLDQA